MQPLGAATRVPFLRGSRNPPAPTHIAAAGRIISEAKSLVILAGAGAVCGDGGFVMNSQELETAVREKVPFVTLIWEDSSYGLIKWKEQEQFDGEHCNVKSPMPTP